LHFELKLTEKFNNNIHAFADLLLKISIYTLDFQKYFIFAAKLLIRDLKTDVSCYIGVSLMANMLYGLSRNTMRVMNFSLINWSTNMILQHSHSTIRM
jgi:hypothetical protein